MAAAEAPDNGPWLRQGAVCDLTGATYRQLDHWDKLDVVTPSHPAQGSGTCREWSVVEAALIRVCAHMSAIGAGIEKMHAVVDALTDQPALWSGAICVDVAAQVAALGTPPWPEGVLIDARACMDHVEKHVRAATTDREQAA